MPKLSIVIRKNALVVDFHVHSNALPDIIKQQDFQKKEPGVYLFEKTVTSLPRQLLIRMTIFGLGSDKQPPRAVCLTKVAETLLEPYIAGSIGRGQSMDDSEYIYDTSPKVSAKAKSTLKFSVSEFQ